MLNSLFKNRSLVSHSVLNLAHPAKFAGARDNALRDAVARLIEYGMPVEIDANEKESQGEIRYLKNILVKHGILRKSKDHLASTAYYELTPEPQTFKKELPALFALVDFLRNIGQGQKENIWPKLQELTDSPYGVGPYALSLFMAIAIRYLGDELRLKPQPTQIGYAPLNDPELIIAVATGQFPSATVERVEKTKAVTLLIDGVYGLFSETPSTAGSHQTQTAAWQSLLAWWKKRTRLERTSGIYASNSIAQKFAEMMTNYETLATAAQSFLDELKIVNGFDPSANIDEAQARGILAEITNCKSTIATHADTIKHTVVTSIGMLFAPQGNTYLDYGDAIRTWFNGLHKDQKDKQAFWQTNPSRTLLDALNKISDVEKLLLEDIPASQAFNTGKVDDWTYDRTNEYVERFQKAKDAIDNGLPKLPSPEWETNQNPGVSSHESDLISYNNQITLSVTAPVGVIVRVTKDTDPTLAKQYEAVGEGSIKTFSVTDSCIYYLVSNAAGEFSKIIKLTFRNQDDDYNLIPETQAKLEPGRRFYSFRNPVDKNGLKVLLGNLIQLIRDNGLLSEEDISQAFNEAVSSQPKMKKGKQK